MPGIPLMYGSFVMAPDAKDPVAEGEFRLRIPAAALFGRSGREAAGADGSLSEDLREVLALHVDLERGRLDLPRVIEGARLCGLWEVLRCLGLGEQEQDELFSEARKSAASGGMTEDGREARLGKALDMLLEKSDVRREPVEEELRVLTNPKGLCELIAGVVRLTPEEQTEFRKLILDQA